jgi:hypothetical protein
MTETVSAVLVPVPEAERVVSRHRARLDAAAAAITAGTLETRTVAKLPLAG